MKTYCLSLKTKEQQMLSPEDITAKLAEQGIGEDNAKEATKEEASAVEAPKEEPVLTAEVDPVEEEAKAAGWKEDGVKSAEEYLRAAPLYDEIKTRGKEIKELKVTMDEMAAHMKKQQEVERTKVMAELQQKRTDAIEVGDVEAVNKADVAIQKEVAPIHNPAVEAFKERNIDWLGDDSAEGKHMQAFVQELDNKYAQMGLEPAYHLEQLEKKVQQEFPHRFKEAEPEPTVAAVEGAQGGAVSSKRKAKFSFSDLNNEQKNCARHFAKRGVMDNDTYIKHLVEQGELK